MTSRVAECIEDDVENQDLASTLCRTNQLVSCSGLAEGEYLDLKHILQADRVNEFESYRHLPFPQELRSQLSKSQSNISMGLLPEISRAWMSVDNDLFFWNFDTNDDVAFFDSIQDTIIQIALVKPKISLVDPGVHFVLVVVTATEITLLAVCFVDDQMKIIPRGIPINYSKSQMVIPSEVLFATPNDCARPIQDIAGTANGRIFFASGDSLFELTYQKGTWLRGSRCDKLNISKSFISHFIPALNFFTTPEEVHQIAVDNSRHFLYTLGERGTIQCFDLEADGTKIRKVSHLSLDDIRNEVRMNCTVEDEFLASIKYIKAIPSTKSRYIALEAVTSKALRIYFTVYNRDDVNYAGGIDQTHARAKALKVVHVRYPPCHVFGIHCGNHIYSAHVDTEVVFVAQMPENNSTILNILSRSSFQYTETAHVESNAEFNFDGYIWDFARLPPDPLPHYDVNLIPPVMPPWVAYEHLVPSRKIYVLTSEGVYVFLQHSPLQMFRQILRLYETDSRQFQWFLSVHFATEVCIMALIVLCSTDPEDVPLHMSAARIIVEFGGEAITTVTNEYDHSFYAPNNVSVANVSAFVNTPLKSSTPQGKSPLLHYGTPHVRSPYSNDENMPIEMEHIRPSSRHEAIYIYFSRLVSSFWSRKVCFRERNILVNNLPMEDVEKAAVQIERLLTTIQQHNLIHFNTTAPHLTPTLLKAGEQEHNSLLQFCEMAKTTYELLNLWKILDEHQFHILTRLLPDDVYAGFPECTFNELVVRSRDLGGELVTCVIKHYIGDEATTALISQRLGDECPSLFTYQDAMLLRASEYIATARHLPYGTERFNNVRKAVDIILKSVGRVNMDLVFNLLQQVHAYDAIVEIVLERAQSDDPTKVAIIAYKKNLDFAEPKIRDAVRARETSYKYINELLHMLQQRIQAGTTSDQTSDLSVPMAINQRDAIIQTILDCEDELAQVHLFQWMLKNGMANQLVNKQHKFFEDFLYHELHEGAGRDYLELLWQYYEKNGNYLAAAKLLLQYAEDSTKIPLKDRLTYLSHALLCIQTAGESRANIELKNRIQEFLAVAQVQQLMKDEIEKSSKIIPEVREKALKHLDDRLFTLNQLYEEFADPLRLPKMKLTILKCANHCDPDAVEGIWHEILVQDLEGFEHNETADQVRRTLTDTLSKLYRMYSTSQDYIPMNYILREVLMKAFSNATPQWLPRICMDSGIPLAALLSVATTVFTNDDFWRRNSRAVDFLVDFGKFVFDDFIKNASLMSANDRSVLKEQCLKFIATLTLNTNAIRGGMSSSDDSSSSSSDEGPRQYQQGPSSHSGLSDEEDSQQKTSPVTSPPAPAQETQKSSSSAESSPRKDSSDSDSDVPAPRPASASSSSSSSSSSGESEKKESEQEDEKEESVKDVTVGDTAMPELSSDSDDGKEEKSPKEASDDDGPRLYHEEEEVEAPQPPIEYRIPLVRGDYGKDGPILTRWPNFISVDTHPFIEELYDTEGDDINAVDAEGRSRLQLKVENCIRWRNVLDADGNPVLDEDGKPKRESNCKMTRWSDGTMTLHLGSEVYEINEQEIKEYNQLFLHMRSGLHGNAVFKKRFAFRPLSTDSLTHKKMTITMAEKTNKSQRVQLLVDPGFDPEAGRANLVRREEEKLRANIRREQQQRKQKERQYRSGLSYGFLEDREEDDDDPESLAAIKRQYNPKSRYDRFDAITRRYGSSEEDDDDSRRIERSKIESDDEEEPSSSSKKKEEKKKRKIVISDDED